MPDKATLDQTALDYGVLVAGVKGLREEKSKLETDIQAAAEQRSMLNKEIAEAQDAKVRVRQELVDIEEQKKAMDKVANDEIAAEKRVLEEQRQKLAQGMKQMTDIENSLKQRTAEVEGRERALREAQSTNEAKSRALIVEAGRIDNEKVSMTVRENLATNREKAVEKKEIEVAEKLRKAEIAESNQKSAVEESRALVKRASDDRLSAQSQLLELKEVEQRNQEALKQIKLFCEVAEDALRYMKNNVKNYDAIDNYFKVTFPALVSRTSNV